MIVVFPNSENPRQVVIPRGQSFYVSEDNTLMIKDGDGDTFVVYHPDHWRSVEVRPLADTGGPGDVGMLVRALTHADQGARVGMQLPGLSEVVEIQSVRDVNGTVVLHAGATMQIDGE